MKSRKAAGSMACAAVFFAVIFISVWFVSPAKTSLVKELTFDQSITRIKNREVGQISIRGDKFVFEDKFRNRFFTKLDDTDESRLTILKAADESGTKISLEPASGCRFILCEL